MAAGRYIAARPGIGFHHLTRRKKLLFLDDDRAGLVSAVLVGPNAGGDVCHRIDDVLRSIIADHAVGPLRRVAADRQPRVHQQAEPVGRLLDRRAALRDDDPIVLAARQNLLRYVGQACERRARRSAGEVHWTVWEKVPAADFWRDVAFADIGALAGGESLAIAARRLCAIKINVRER